MPARTGCRVRPPHCLPACQKNATAKKSCRRDAAAAGEAGAASHGRMRMSGKYASRNGVGQFREAGESEGLRIENRLGTRTPVPLHGGEEVACSCGVGTHAWKGGG
eukprot:242336-Chlamydomonas_euryale.AAC.2